MIVCLAWGSLIWNPGELPVAGAWRRNGPDVRVEFVRKSRRDRLTLVLDKATDAVPSLWAPLVVTESRRGGEEVGRARRRQESSSDRENRTVARHCPGDYHPTWTRGRRHKASST